MRKTDADYRERLKERAESDRRNAKPSKKLLLRAIAVEFDKPLMKVIRDLEELTCPEEV